jgi:hypothetical protein
LPPYQYLTAVIARNVVPGIVAYLREKPDAAERAWNLPIISESVESASPQEWLFAEKQSCSNKLLAHALPATHGDCR